MIKKVLKVIAWLIIICVLLVIGNVARKMYILTKLDNSVTELNNSIDNMYKSITYTRNSAMGADLVIYKKDDVIKIVTKMKDGSATLTDYYYPSVRRTYSETKESKIVDTKTDDLEPIYKAVIDNFTHSNTFNDRIIAAFNTTIKNVELNGKKCYELSGDRSPLFLYNGDSMEFRIYLEKDTGIPVKQIEKCMIDNEIVDYIIDYEYKFDVVKDEDMKEPDVSEYTVFEPLV